MHVFACACMRGITLYIYTHTHTTENPLIHTTEPHSYTHMKCCHCISLPDDTYAPFNFKVLNTVSIAPYLARVATFGLLLC